MTVARDPGDNGALAILFGMPQGVSVICPPGTGTDYGNYCYMPAGASSFTYFLVAGLVGGDVVDDVIASNSGNPGDHGQTSQLTVLAMRSSVSMSPPTL